MPSKMSENWKSYMLFCRILFQFMPAILMTSLYTTIFLKVREQEQLMSRYTYKQKVKYVQAYRNVQLRYFVLIRSATLYKFVHTCTHFFNCVLSPTNLCTDIHKRTNNCTISYKYVQLCIKAYTYVHIPMNSFIYVHIPENAYKYEQIRSNRYKYVKIRRNAYEYVQMRTKTFQYVQ